MTVKEFFSFRQNKFFWINIIGIILAVALILFGVLKGIDFYTRHGEAVTVPDVKGMGLAEADKMFRNQNLKYVVSDSTYVENMAAGCIVDYTPSAGQKVKEGRTVYVTINALSIPLQTIPDVADNSSVRQAEARLLASGFKLDEVQYVPGETDWVYGVKYHGRLLSLNEKVPVGARLTLMVGDGSGTSEPADSLNEGGTEDIEEHSSEPARPAPAKSSSRKSASDESWF